MALFIKSSGQHAGLKTVAGQLTDTQFYINGEHVGGADDQAVGLHASDLIPVQSMYWWMNIMARQTNTLGQQIGVGIDDWKPRSRPERTPMIGHYCRIEPLRIEAHAEQLYQAFSADPQEGDWTYLPYGPFNCLEDFRCWLTEDCSGDDPLFHVVIDSNSSRAVGLASYLRIEPSVGVIEVGHIHFSPSMQKTPMATEAMYLMMRRVFDELGYRRYEWKCDVCNERSKRAALRLGFSFEGTFRQATIYKGRNRDTAWFSLLDSEWPAMRAAFESWLKVDNFDGQDQQKRRLNN